jgi:molecular chaperone GrpE
MENFLVEALLITIVVCIAGVVWYTVTTRARIARLAAESRERLSQEQAKHEKHVDRLARKFDVVSERGHLDFAADLLPTIDALGHALQECQQSDQFSGVREGLEMVDRELEAVLSKHGIETCSPMPGDTFDAGVHEAVAIVDNDVLPPNSVAECFRPGYVHDERVLRSAAVAVTGKDKGEPEGPDEPDQPGTSSPGDVDDEASIDVSSSPR